jgi:hypothetical protein
MVEGKVNESFGLTLGAWRKDASPGKDKRLRFLMRTLALDTHPVNAIRYQLLHRAASAVITGEQYRAIAAIVLVHSFSEERTGWPDYQAFARLFGVEARLGSVQRLSGASAVPLYGLWVVGNCLFLQSWASAGVGFEKSDQRPTGTLPFGPHGVFWHRTPARLVMVDRHPPLQEPNAVVRWVCPNDDVRAFHQLLGKFPEDLLRLNADRATDLDEFDHLKAPLAPFILRHKTLVPL